MSIDERSDLGLWAACTTIAFEAGAILSAAGDCFWLALGLAVGGLISAIIMVALWNGAGS